jgi:hypothetical protein
MWPLLPLWRPSFAPIAPCACSSTLTLYSKFLTWYHNRILPIWW